ncbi:hypothetical protein EYZ11_002945 [Aspergillus tanneri]|uniref:Uncharacterized protein n=1 Tax=Aspergillus tanneri TaxID=1220188 RepID=A0A4S3JQ74_9EURO|nr:hypothetical protein EYZ11_002945 [Aspergillus tanneri]
MLGTYHIRLVGSRKPPELKRIVLREHPTQIT